jgi:hypothetical protein
MHLKTMKLQNYTHEIDSQQTPESDSNENEERAKDRQDAVFEGAIFAPPRSPQDKHNRQVFE